MKARSSRMPEPGQFVPAPRIELSPRRGLRREAASLYVGVSPSKFDEMVSDGRMPKPKRIDGCVVWDLRRLDLAWDALGGDDGADANPLDEALGLNRPALRHR